MIKIFEEIEGLVSSKISSLKTILSIFKMEASLAGLSVYPLLLNLCMLFVVLLTLWFSIMLLIGYFAVLFFGGMLWGMLTILVLNLGLFMGLVKYLTFNLKNMSFAKTRTYLSTKESSKDDKLKKEINSQNCNSGTNITIPTNSNNKT